MVFYDGQGQLRTLVISSTESLKKRCADALAEEREIHCLSTLTGIKQSESFWRRDHPVVVVVELGQFELDDLTPFMDQSDENECAVITITPSLERSFVIDALRKGVRGFLTEDVDGGEVVRAVKGVGDGEIWVSRELLYEAFFEQMGQVATEENGSVDELNHLLTPREQDILNCLRKGLSDKEIARSLGISHKTVKTHLQHIFRKTKIHSRLQLAMHA